MKIKQTLNTRTPSSRTARDSIRLATWSIQKAIEEETRNFVPAPVPKFQSLQTTNMRPDVYHTPEHAPQHLNPLIPTTEEWERLQAEYDEAEDERERALAENNAVANSVQNSGTDKEEGYGRGESMELWDPKVRFRRGQWECAWA